MAGFLRRGRSTSIHVGGDVKGGADSASGSVISYGTIASIVVDGSLFGGDLPLSGSLVTVNGLDRPPTLLPALTKVSIGGYIQGGQGDFSGIVQSAGAIGTLMVGPTAAPATMAATTTTTLLPGDVAGGGGQYSGSIDSGGNMGTITIAGSLLGNADGSGQIYSEASIAKLTIAGSVKAQGSYQANDALSITAGQIVALKTLTFLEVTGDIFGGAGDSSAEINAGAIGSVIVHGSLYGGGGASSGSVRAFSGDLGSLKVDGAIEAKGPNAFQYISALHNIGTVTAGSIVGSGAPVLIMATGQVQPKTAAAALAIKSVSTAGVMMNTQILAGLQGAGGNLTVRNPEASIGTVEVGTGGDQPNIYTGNDISAGFMLSGFQGLKGAVLSKLSHVIIHGTIGQTSGSYSILADFISSITVGGVAAPLKPGAQNDLHVPVGADASGAASVFASERELS